MIWIAIVIVILLILLLVIFSSNNILGSNEPTEFKNKSTSSYMKLKKMVKNNNVIFLTGRAGVGKSYVGHKLEKDTGYKYISVDDMILNMIDAHPDKYALFQIYGEGDAYPEERKKLLDDVKNKIKKYNKVILDGMLRQKDIDYIKADLVVYIEPYDWKDYPKALKQRVKNDIKNGTKTINIVWRQLEDNYTNEELDEAISYASVKQHIYSDKLKKQYDALIYRNKF